MSAHPDVKSPLRSSTAPRSTKANARKQKAAFQRQTRPNASRIRWACKCNPQPWSLLRRCRSSVSVTAHHLPARLVQSCGVCAASACPSGGACRPSPASGTGAEGASASGRRTGPPVSGTPRLSTRRSASARWRPRRASFVARGSLMTRGASTAPRLTCSTSRAPSAAQCCLCAWTTRTTYELEHRPTAKYIPLPRETG